MSGVQPISAEGFPTFKVERCAEIGSIVDSRACWKMARV